MAITNPTLPPRKGYVEIVEEDGKRGYKATAEQLEQKEASSKLKEIETVLNELLGVQGNE